MSYQDTEVKLNQITDNLTNELRDANAIDDSGNVIDVPSFNSIINDKIDKCNNILMELETSGQRYDPNTNNIIFSRIQLLRDMQSAQSVYPHAQEQLREDKVLTKQPTITKQTLWNGIRRIFNKKNPTATHGRSK